MRRLFYSSSVDQHDLSAWGPLADALRRNVHSACGKDVVVEIGDRPVFGYGTDIEETLAELEEKRLSRTVRLDLWSSIVFYSAVAITLGSEIKRPERRALEKSVRKTLRGQQLLRTTEGPYFDDSAQVFGYAMSAAGDAAARASIEHMLFPFDPPLYLGERWLVQDEQERIDEASFEAITEVAPGLATFFARSGEAEELVWQGCSTGEGLIACFPDDPALASLFRSFHDMADLRIFLADQPSAGMRVTLDRCHQDDQLVVAYTPPEPPEVDQPYLFLI